ncbi:hypothetical protein LguiB_032768 [Lonicera macranthoides]
MAVSLTNFSWFSWGGKEKDSLSNGSSSNSNSNDWDSVKLFPLFKPPKMASSKVKRKWQSREQRRVDKEYDMVIVPSDGVGLSGSDSDDSDWSIGWLEPHAPDFYQSDDEDEKDGGNRDESFAVLVPCYRDRFNSRREFESVVTNSQLLSDIKNLPGQYSAEGKKFMEQWLSSLPNF